MRYSSSSSSGTGRDKKNENNPVGVKKFGLEFCTKHKKSFSCIVVVPVPLCIVPVQDMRQASIPAL